MSESCGLILAAAGVGSRFGSGFPKQFQLLGGKPLYRWALQPFLDQVAEVVIVVPDSWEGRIGDEMSRAGLDVKVEIEVGGDSRQESVSKGLERLNPNVQYVLVHDAARPYVSGSLIRSVLQAARQFDACIPVLPVRDTVKRVRKGVVVDTIDRNSLGFSQTPQGFEVSLLRRAFSKAIKDGFSGTDEASLVEHLGAPVHVVKGCERNVKVTWPHDLREFPP